MLHIPGLSYDGVMGYPVLQMARETIGMGIGVERFGHRFSGTGRGSADS